MLLACMPPSLPTPRSGTAGLGVFCVPLVAPEEGKALKPSREPPHDCALGRLLSTKDQVVKPPGSFRRPWLCLCYVTDAPRLPSGTLRNKLAAQGVRALHPPYGGSGTEGVNTNNNKGVSNAQSPTFKI